MDAEQIKEFLFEYIENSETIPGLIAEKRYDEIIKNVTDSCYDKIISMENQDQSVQVLATVLLHYLLTCAQITSQRKIEYDKKEIDIVIPDIKTLEGDPKKTLLICIPKSSDLKTINEEIAKMEAIQPEKENIWMVLSKDTPVEKRTFVLSRKHNTFSDIIFEIAKFSNVGGSSKLKILRV